MGCSAGSIGAQIWSDNSLNMIKWQKAAVIPDSYAGVFPDGSQGPLIYGFVCCCFFFNFILSTLLIFVNIYYQ